MENYEHIYYLNCPHFTVGNADQWGEHGYLLFEDKVYAYEQDRKDQCGRTYSPLSIDKFLEYAKWHGIEIPDHFKQLLADISNEQIETSVRL